MVKYIQMSDWQKMIVSGLGWIIPLSKILLMIILFVVVIVTIIAVSKWNDGSKSRKSMINLALGGTFIICLLNIGLLVALRNVTSKVNNAFNDNETGINYTDNVSDLGFSTHSTNWTNYLKLYENTNSDHVTIAKLQYYPNQHKIVFEPLNKTGKAYVRVVRYLDKLKRHEHLANIKIDASLSSTRADFETINGKRSIICYANNKGVSNNSIKVLRY